MEKEFITYEQALALKELGFDEPCLKMAMSEVDIINAERTDERDYPKNSDLFSGWVAIPTYSASFRWFREKQNIDNCISYSRIEDNSWYYQYYKSGLVGGFKTYEEAEQACLDKLIEICKTK